MKRILINVDTREQIKEIRDILLDILPDFWFLNHRASVGDHKKFVLCDLLPWTPSHSDFNRENDKEVICISLVTKTVPYEGSVWRGLYKTVITYEEFSPKKIKELIKQEEDHGKETDQETNGGTGS